MRKFLISFPFVLSAFASQGFSETSTDNKITRAQVKSEIVRLEEAGYSPASEHTTYPNKLIATEERLRISSEKAADRSYGGSVAAQEVSSFKLRISDSSGVTPVDSGVSKP